MKIEITLKKEGKKELTLGIAEGVDGKIEIRLVFRNKKEYGNCNYYPKIITITKIEILEYTYKRLFRTIETFQEYILDENSLLFMLTHESEEIKEYLYKRYPLTDELDLFYKRSEDDK